MMRKLTATGLAVAAVAGLGGAGAAFASSNHSAKQVAAAAVVHRHADRDSSRERSSKDRSHEARSADRSSHDVESAR